MKTRTMILATTMLTLAAGACDDLPAGDVTDPEYWGDAFLTKYEDELVVGELEPGPTPLEKPRVVLLITGVTIPAEWFEPIEARLERDGFIPVVYEPPALLSGDLFENSEWLSDVVDEVRQNTGHDTIDILAECTGGLIARHYIQALGGNEHIGRMVTFISPQHGVAKAPIAAKVAGWPALYDLSPGSDFLETVNSAPLPDDVAFTSIYTCTDEYIQPYETSIIPGAKNIELCDGFVGHFEFFYNPDIYLIMHDALTAPSPKDALEGPVETEEPGDSVATTPGGSEGGALDDVDGKMPVPKAGCSAGGGSDGGSGAWLVLGALGLALHRRRRVGA